ncbi:MAG: 16S rRNA (cytosine(1402)-N(4))-methyltransferase RsmH [Planctomycetota bacterium]|jgi:16S rRNA (cytosine1402-N4)-methyltransferase
MGEPRPPELGGDQSGHTPVLLAETLRLLDVRPDGTVVDLTAGRGGHSVALARAVGPGGVVIGFDLDPDSLAFADRRVREAGGRFEPVNDSFLRAPQHLADAGRQADAVLADLGFSSRQMDDPNRGFGFAVDGPLDMRYDPRNPVTAEKLLASLNERELAELIRRYGEDPFARKIARKLALAGEHEPIRSTAQLAELVREAYGPRASRSRVHPATRTFMALRIAVNDELTALSALLEHLRLAAARAREGGGWLQPGARVAIISFHSLEDRLVKRAFAALANDHLAARLTKRPVTPGPQEIADNPRCRSAKLRAIRLSDGNGR